MYMYQTCAWKELVVELKSLLTFYPDDKWDDMGNANEILPF